MKLIRDSKIVKLPRSSRSVEGALKAAMNEANAKGWNKVIIIGEGDTASWRYNAMSDTYALGMLEKTKNSILND